MSLEVKETQENIYVEELQENSSPITQVEFEEQSEDNSSVWQYMDDVFDEYPIRCLEGDHMDRPQSTEDLLSYTETLKQLDRLPQPIEERNNNMTTSKYGSQRLNISKLSISDLYEYAAAQVKVHSDTGEDNYSSKSLDNRTSTTAETDPLLDTELNPMDIHEEKRSKHHNTATIYNAIGLRRYKTGRVRNLKVIKLCCLG